MIRLREEHQGALNDAVYRRFVLRARDFLNNQVPHRVSEFSRPQLYQQIDEVVVRLERADFEHEVATLQAVSILALVDWEGDENVDWIKHVIHSTSGDDDTRAQRLLQEARSRSVADLEAVDLYRIWGTSR